MPEGSCAGTASHPLRNALRCSQADASGRAPECAARSQVLFPYHHWRRSSFPAARRPANLCLCLMVTAVWLYLLQPHYYNLPAALRLRTAFCTDPLTGGILCQSPYRKRTRISGLRNAAGIETGSKECIMSHRTHRARALANEWDIVHCIHWTSRSFSESIFAARILRRRNPPCATEVCTHRPETAARSFKNTL